MSDVIVSGDTVSRPVDKSPPPTVEVQMEPPAAPAEQLPNDGEDIVLRRIEGEPIHMDESGDALRKEIRARRERESDPIVEWKADALPDAGEHESFGKQIKRASESMREARLAALGKQYAELPGVSEQDGRNTAEILASAPPTKVVPVNDAGVPIQPLRDDQPITELDAFANRAEMKRGMSQYRDAQERAQQQLLADLQAEEARQIREAEAAATPPPPSPPPAQPDPGQVERARLQAERDHLVQVAHWNRLSASEQSAAHEAAQIEQWARQAQGDERAQWLGEAERRYGQLRAHLQHSAQYRAVADTAAQQARQQQVAQWGAAQDSLAESSIKKEMPEFSSDAAWKQLQQATKRALRESTGLTDQQLTAEWHQGRWRSAPEQRMLARLGRDQLAREGMKDLNAHKRSIPPVTPGVARPRGADGDLDQVRAIERQLDGAKGQRALQLGQQLIQARRAAGLLQQSEG